MTKTITAVAKGNWFSFVLCFLCLQLPLTLTAQNQNVTGKVTGQDGEVLPGVSILVKGTTTGTATNAGGVFTITAPANGTLIFSFIGYVSEEVPVNGRNQINVALVPDLEALEEVVVVGYGTQRRSDLTGSIASVSAREIRAVPVTGIGQALQGRAAGVQVTQTSMPLAAGFPSGCGAVIRSSAAMNPSTSLTASRCTTKTGPT